MAVVLDTLVQPLRTLSASSVTPGIATVGDAVPTPALTSFCHMQANGASPRATPCPFFFCPDAAGWMPCRNSLCTNTSTASKYGRFTVHRTSLDQRARRTYGLMLSTFIPMGNSSEMLLLRVFRKSQRTEHQLYILAANLIYSCIPFPLSLLPFHCPSLLLPGIGFQNKLSQTSLASFLLLLRSRSFAHLYPVGVIPWIIVHRDSCR